MPPGPPTMPVLGNLHQVGIGTEKEALYVLMHCRCQPKMLISNSRNGRTNMGTKQNRTTTLKSSFRLILCSPVYSLMLGTKPTIVLSSDLAIKDLLDKKGNIYSDRPDMYISQGVASGGHRLVVMVSEVLLGHPWSRCDCSCLQQADLWLLYLRAKARSAQHVL